MNKVLVIGCLLVFMCIVASLSVAGQNQPGRDPAADWKHPTDKCPVGTHEVVKETTKTASGEAKMETSGAVKAVGVKGGGGGKVEKTTVEKEKVCRDNADSDMKEKNTAAPKK